VNLRVSGVGTAATQSGDGFVTGEAGQRSSSKRAGCADRSARSDRSSARSSPATASSSRTRSANALNASSTRAGSYPSPARGRSSVWGSLLISLKYAAEAKKPAHADFPH
jgi:hypothetical protein